MARSSLKRRVMKRSYAPHLSIAIAIFAGVVALFLYYTHDLGATLLLASALAAATVLIVLVIHYSTLQTRTLLSDMATVLYDKAVALEEVKEGGGDKKGEVPPEIFVTPNIGMGDVGDMESVKKRLIRGVIYPLRHHDAYVRYKRAATSSILLYGPPGCGKTMLALALAKEAGVRFAHVRITDVMSKWLGESEKNIARIFSEAKKNAPAIVFIDEIDALGLKRGSITGEASRRVLNQLLMEMDSIARDGDKVCVIGATNAPWDLDPALRRTGRFAQFIFVPPPDAKGREAVLRIHCSGRPISGDVDFRRLAELTKGYTASDLAQLCESAADIPLEDEIKTGKGREIEMRDFERALKTLRPSLDAWALEARQRLALGEGGVFSDLNDFLKEISP